MTIYAIVGGWTIIYAFESLYSYFSSTPWVGFGDVLASPVYLIGGQGAFMASTVIVRFFSVCGRGLEKCCKYLMPLLFLIVAVLVVRALTMDGAMQGLAFYLTPDFSKVGMETVLSALGMAFFSLSLGMGAMITYASYLKRDGGVLSPGIWMVVLDTSVCFLGGYVRIPGSFLPPELTPLRVRLWCLTYYLRYSMSFP